MQQPCHTPKEIMGVLPRESNDALAPAPLATGLMIFPRMSEAIYLHKDSSSFGEAVLEG
jgi:hypothetical protein